MWPRPRPCCLRAPSWLASRKQGPKESRRRRIHRAVQIRNSQTELPNSVAAKDRAADTCHFERSEQRWQAKGRTPKLYSPRRTTGFGSPSGTIATPQQLRLLGRTSPWRSPLAHAHQYAAAQNRAHHGDLLAWKSGASLAASSTTSRLRLSPQSVAITVPTPVPSYT